MTIQYKSLRHYEQMRCGKLTEVNAIDGVRVIPLIMVKCQNETSATIMRSACLRFCLVRGLITFRPKTRNNIPEEFEQNLDVISPSLQRELFLPVG